MVRVFRNRCPKRVVGSDATKVLRLTVMVILGVTPRLFAATTLTHAAQVHGLSPHVARSNLPVRIEGVVTHYHRELGDGLTLQDETDGVYVSLRGHKPEVRVGDRVIVEGVSGSGDYAPVVLFDRLEILGSGTLPKPEKVTAASLATGQYDSRQIEVRGIVRSAVPAFRTDRPHLAIELRSDGIDLGLRVDRYRPESTNLVDAEVVVRGGAAGLFSWRRQLLAPIVVVESDADIEVIRPARPASELPHVTLGSLFHYSPAGFPQHRVRVKGQLLGVHAGGWISVRDETGGVFVAAEGETQWKAGDAVDIVGFPEMRDHTLWLLRASVVRQGPGTPAAAVPSTMAQALRSPCELRCVEGVLSGPPLPGSGSWVLGLRSETDEFEAWIPATGAQLPDWLRDGAKLEVTGITEPYVLPSQRSTMFPFPRGLRLHGRSIRDVVLLKSAPWWTSPRLSRTVMAGLVGAVALLGLSTLTAAVLARKNAALREARSQLAAARDELARRYSRRTGEWQEELAARHAAEADFALLTAERTRLARELHDTLEQTLASTALQLDAARGFFRDQPTESERLLIEATEQLRESQREVRRSVWNLRSVKLEEATLPEALRQLSEALRDRNGPVVEMRCEGAPRMIPPGAASQLFRVAQEGLTNALKHAQPGKVDIVLKFDPDVLELSIIDDGIGFLATAPEIEGHFGLRGLRERARALRGVLELDTSPGQGTRLRLKVPMSHLEDA